MITAVVILALAAEVSGLEQARDRQDRGALERAAAALARTTTPGDAAAQYRLAVTESYVAEVALELKDKRGAAVAAEAGIKAAEKAVTAAPKTAEYHRILGTLCGQAAPASVLLAFKYGSCARSEIEKAIELDPKSAAAYVSRGVGNYYLPPALGGGVDRAIGDFRRAVELDPRSAEARLWLGIALRKAGKNAEARKEISKSLALNPNRTWARQQLEKTPAR